MYVLCDRVVFLRRSFTVFQVLDASRARGARPSRHNRSAFEMKVFVSGIGTGEEHPLYDRQQLLGLFVSMTCSSK